MGFNLFALLKKDNEYQVKLISLSKKLQWQLKEEFISQYADFISGVDDEIEFTGDWKPDENQFLLLKDLREIDLIEKVKSENADSFSPFDIKNDGQHIKAIFSILNIDNKDIVLIQKINKNQIIEHDKWLLFLDGNVFNKISEPTLEISDRIVAIIEDRVIKFKSFNYIRCIFDVLHCFMEATDSVVRAFSTHPKIKSNEDDFVKIADSVIRKQITQLNKSGILDSTKVTDINKKYKAYTGKELTLDNGKIVLLSDKKEVKQILNFLLENLFSGILSNAHYQTNSKRKLK